MPHAAVVASEKGVVVGRLTFNEDGDAIDCSKMGVGGKAIPPNIDKARCPAVASAFSTADNTICLRHNYNANYLLRQVNLIIPLDQPFSCMISTSN